MNQFHLFIVLLFGAFLMPNLTMACSDHIDKSIEREISSSKNQHHKACCSDDADSKKDHKSCSGNCEQSCCPCAISSSSSAFNAIFSTIFKNNNSTFFIDKKTEFAFISGVISDGFLSIWLIPKIG